jgi:integrase
MSITVKLIERKMKNGGSSFYLESYVNKKRGYIPVDMRIDPKDDVKTKKEKHQILNAIRSQTELDLLSKGTAYVPSHRKNIDLFDYLQEYINNYQKKDQKMIFAAVKKFIEYINKDHLDVKDLDKKMAKGFRDYLLSPKAKLTGETPQNYLDRFKKTIKAAVDDEILNTNPFDDVVIKRSETNQTIKKEVLTIDEIRLLAKTPSENQLIKDAFLFACYSGLGLAEVLILGTKHVKEGRMKIHRVKTGILINIPLSKSALDILKKQTIVDGRYFPITYTTNGVNKNIIKWVEKANINKPVSFYVGRHTFATQLLKNGADLLTVSKCLGHSGVNYTTRYLNHLEDLIEKSIYALPQI